jgi:ABC-2 type transport system permease protein
LREPSPAKIANGFGGTMNLLASAAYLLAIILVVAIPSAFLVTGDQLTEVRLGWFWNDFVGLGSARAVAIGMTLAVALFALATVVPMRIGIRAFERLEA